MNARTTISGTTIAAVLAGTLGLSTASGAAEPQKVKRENRFVWTGDELGALRKVAALGRGYLGIETLEISEGLREHYGAPKDGGVLVAGVAADSPAAAAGLAVGDVLVAVDGEKVTSSWGILKRVRPRKEGDRVELEIIRDGRSRTLSASLAERERAAIDFGDAFEWQQDGSPERRLRFRREGDGEGEGKEFDVLIAPEVRLRHLEGLQERLNSIDWSQVPCPQTEVREALEKRIERLEKRLQEMRERLDKVGDRR